MLRQVALDTETTGKSDDGTPGDHRIIEIGCVEIIDRRITGRELQVYINPERPVDEGATRVHGMTWDDLKDKPLFRDIAPELIDFIRGSELLIHNAKFDTSFLDREFALMGLNETTASMASVTDTVALALRLHRGIQVNLDNLCNKFGVSNKHRVQHGALLDAQLLAEVYLAMTGGQTGFNLAMESNAMEGSRWRRPEGFCFKVMPVEVSRHAVHVDTMIDLAQGCKTAVVDDQQMAGSNWSREYDMPYLEKGKEESKGDYKKRLKEQKSEIISRLLSQAELDALARAKEVDGAAYKEWEDRVMGRTPV